MRAARLRAIVKWPYFATAITSVELRELDIIPTACITKEGILCYNPSFVETLDVDMKAKVIVHEIQHLLRDHYERGESFADKERWNLAGDLEINDSLKPVPDNWMLPEKFNLKPDQIAEKYYRELEGKTKPASFWGGSCGSGAGNPIPGEPQGGPLNKARKEVIKKKVAKEILKRGNVPSSLERWAKSVINPRIPWEQELMAACTVGMSSSGAKADYDPMTPSRRSEAFDPFIVPALRSPQPRVAVIVDTSGSMNENQMGVALNVLAQALNVADQVYLVAGDVRAHVLKPIQDMSQAKLIGGGGTDMGSIARETWKQVRPDFMVIVTDGYTPWKGIEEVKCPLLTVLVGSGFSPGIGKVVKVEEAYQG